VVRIKNIVTVDKGENMNKEIMARTLTLANGLMKETLHGPIPAESTIALADAVISLSADKVKMLEMIKSAYDEGYSAGQDDDIEAWEDSDACTFIEVMQEL